MAWTLETATAWKETQEQSVKDDNNRRETTADALLSVAQDLIQRARAKLGADVDDELYHAWARIGVVRSHGAKR